MAARYRFTSAADGDLARTVPAEVLARRRRTVADHPWTWLHQVHGTTVVTVNEPGQHAGTDADGAVTAVPGAALAAHSADCGPVVLLGQGAVGVAHAGWRGLLGGVIAETVAAMARLGTGSVRAVIGPCIRPRCYRFSSGDLDRVAAAVGDSVRSHTASGEPALDLASGITAALHAAGVDEVADTGTCTACSPVHYSHRARRDRSRQAAVAWLEP